MRLKFGNHIKLDNQVLGDDGKLNPVIVDSYKTMIRNRSIAVIQKHTTAAGGRLAHPNLHVSVHPGGIWVDMDAEITDPSDALQWYTKDFDLGRWMSNVDAAVYQGCIWWAKKEYGLSFKVDENHAQATKTIHT